VIGFRHRDGGHVRFSSVEAGGGIAPGG